MHGKAAEMAEAWIEALCDEGDWELAREVARAADEWRRVENDPLYPKA